MNNTKIENIEKVFIIPLGTWYYSKSCKIEYGVRCGDCSTVKTIVITNEERETTVDIGQCVVVEKLP